MKGLIIFKGKYGATEQYAKWISESLKLEAVNAGKVKKEQLMKTDFLVIGTSIYIGKFQIHDWLKKQVEEIRNKKLYLFIVSATPLNEREKLNEYLQPNIPQEIKNKAEIFFLPGRLIFKKLSWLDKLLLKIGASFAKNSEEKKRMLTDFDNVMKENIGELIDAVKKGSMQTETV